MKTSIIEKIDCALIAISKVGGIYPNKYFIYATLFCQDGIVEITDKDVQVEAYSLDEAAERFVRRINSFPVKRKVTLEEVLPHVYEASKES